MRNKKRKGKFVALLLAVMLIVGLIPVNVFAVSENDGASVSTLGDQEADDQDNSGGNDSGGASTDADNTDTDDTEDDAPANDGAGDSDSSEDGEAEESSDTDNADAGQQGGTLQGSVNQSSENGEEEETSYTVTFQDGDGTLWEVEVPSGATLWTDEENTAWTDVEEDDWAQADNETEQWTASVNVTLGQKEYEDVLVTRYLVQAAQGDSPARYYYTFTIAGVSYFTYGGETPTLEGAAFDAWKMTSGGSDFTVLQDVTFTAQFTDAALVHITSWTWVDEQEILTESDGSWGIGLPGVSEDNPLTREVLSELLPTQITAITDGGDTLVLDLTWDLTAIPEEGASSGDYTVTAALADSGYALAEDADPLTVTVQLGGAETYALSLPTGDASNAPYSSHIVNGVSPNGTTIDLFDYWITAQTDADNSNGSGYGFISQGINANHALLFGNGLSDYNNKNGAAWFGNWNTWTGDESPRTGIVQTELGDDGYPVLNLGNITSNDASQLTGRNGSESLAYLFNPDIDSDGKASYEDVQGLLQVDSDGYYYYNSQENYAVYYPGSNSFALYAYPGVLPGGNSPVGQFFPFNIATADAQEVTVGTGSDAKSYRLMNTSYSNADSINHYFGLHMSTRFIQQYGGHTDNSEQTPVTYEFSGDDDVWIFIDGVLVADLGGIHDAASVSINFATGAITINGTVQNQTLGSILGTGSNTLTDNTYHTLDFFYLERGNVDSNMNLKYNLVTIPESDLIKVDQLGDPVEGAVFTLYAATDTDRNNPIATGTTDSSGEFIFLRTDDAGNSYPITIDELYNSYGERKDSDGNNLILVETYTPPGYRSVGEVGLYFYQGESDEVLLLSNSVWDKGAYAMPKVTTTTGNTIQLLETATGTEVSQTVTLVGSGAVENPLMFAVVFQKQSNGKWLPVSGDPINGWKVWSDSSWSSVLGAAQANQYIFQLASSGAYQVEIDNLPGDIKTYYHICQSEEEAEYTIAYYYTTANTLAEATSGDTWRIDAENTGHPLDRVFSMDLYVTNIKNYLLVQKVDDAGNTVNGAEFSLYKASDVTVATDGTVTVNAGATPYDTLTTANLTSPLTLDGGGIFPTGDNVLELGEYYLIETSAPGGYKLNDTAIHVIVDNTGVYADAGTADDGVSVLRGVGSVMRSMVQFAANDGVDTTLQGIKAALATSVEYSGNYSEDGSFTVTGADIDWNSEETDVLHLQFANANSMLDYGLYDGTAGSIDSLTLATEEGWSKLLIQQCYQHDGTVDTSLKTNLTGTDITYLFSGTVTVRVADERTGNLKISKTVTGDNAPTDQTFSFTVTVKDGQTAISGEYATVGGNGTITFTEGTATVELKAGESLTILALPTGATYTVTEAEVDGYTSSITVTGDDDAEINAPTVTGTIQHNTTENDAVELAYTNTFDGNVRVALNGTKTLLGRNLAETDSFTFTLTAAESYDNVELPQERTATVTGDGTSAMADFSFGEITFKSEGTYIFYITEDCPEGVVADNPVSDGIRYDTHTTTVTVNVEKGDNGILSASVTYDNGSEDTATDDKAVFTNLWASLTISKTVTGDMGDRDKAFSFQITLTDADDQPLTGTYSYTGGTVSGVDGVTAPDDGILELKNDGTATFTLQHGQTITIFGLPSDSSYKISETDAQADGYTTTVTVGTGDSQTVYEVSGTLVETETTQVAFENSRGITTPSTGITLDNWPWLLAGGLALTGGVALFWMKKQGRRARRAARARTGYVRRRGMHVR